LIPRTALRFRLAPERTRVLAELSIARRQQGDAVVPLVLDGDGISLLSIAIDGVALGPAAYRATGHSLTVHALRADRPFVLPLESAAAPCAMATLMGLDRPGGN